MLSNKTVSLLCPTYGRFELLREAYTSMLLQVQQPDEIIIGYDGEDTIKTDNSVKYDGNLHKSVQEAYIDKKLNCKIVRMNPNLFLGQKRDAMIRMASCDIVAWLDDDDLLMPNHLSRVMSFETHRDYSAYKPDVALVTHGRVPQPYTITYGADAQVFYDRQKLLEFGGFPDAQTRHGLYVMKRMRKNNELLHIPCNDAPSYIVRRKFSGNINPQKPKKVTRSRSVNKRIKSQYQNQNNDFADGRLLKPVDISKYYQKIRQKIGNVNILPEGKKIIVEQCQLAQKKIGELL